MAGSARRRLIDRETERSHIGKTSFTAASICLVWREHGVVEDVVDICAYLNCNAGGDVE